MKIQTTVGALALASIIALAGCSTDGSDKSGTTSSGSAPMTSAPVESQTTTSTAPASPSAEASPVDPEAVDGEGSAEPGLFGRSLSIGTVRNFVCGAGLTITL